jgi:hypothetical protein
MRLYRSFLKRVYIFLNFQSRPYLQEYCYIVLQICTAFKEVLVTIVYNLIDLYLVQAAQGISKTIIAVFADLACFKSHTVSFPQPNLRVIVPR